MIHSCCYLRTKLGYGSRFNGLKLKLSWYACILGLLFSSFSIQAKEIIVALEPLGYRPYYYSENGIIKGAVIEIIEHISQHLEHTVKYEEYPWPRMQHYLRIGQVDMVPIYLKTPDRTKYAAFPDTPSFYESYYFYALTNTPKVFDGNLQSIAGLSIGEVRGYSYGVKYDNFNLLNRFQVAGEGQLLRMLLKNRVDLIIANQAVVDDHVKKMKVEHEIDRLSPMIAKTPAYFAFSKAVTGNEALASEFSDALKQFVKTQKYQDILHKYQIEE